MCLWQYIMCTLDLNVSITMWGTAIIIISQQWRVLVKYALMIRQISALMISTEQWCV